MKAIAQTGYGPPGRVLDVADVPRPEVDEGSVLVRVRAASVNALDWRRVRAQPFVVRGEGLLRPRNPLLGVDTAGVVESVGHGIEHLRPGDEVFGIGKGSFAEFTTGTTFVRKPENLTFEEAAAVPVCGSTALQTLRDIATVKPGESVLVNGAGGGVGTFLVQIGKALGCRVTATTKKETIELVTELGADRVIDHSRDDFAAMGERYDVIVEVGRRRTFRDCRDVLAPGGRLVMVGAGGRLGGPIARFVGAQLRSKILRQPVTAFVSWESTDDLEVLREMLEAGTIRPVIDRVIALEDAASGVRQLEEGRARGKVVVSLT